MGKVAASMLATAAVASIRFASCIPPAAATPDEARWLAAARGGERWALARLYDEHQEAIHALCARLLGRAEDAEDATQTTFVRAFRALPGFRADSAIKTWLYRIAVNECLALLRRRRHEAGRHRSDDASGVPGLNDGGAAATAGAGDVRLVAERLVVRDALARLKPDHRAILVLRFWEELSYEEIAVVLGLSLPATKMRLKRAKEAFQSFYQGGAE